jgi:hypothetical protein
LLCGTLLAGVNVIFQGEYQRSGSVAILAVVAYVAILLPSVCEQKGDGGRRDFPRNGFEMIVVVAPRKVEPICPFPRYDTSKVALPPRIPRQVARGLSPRLFIFGGKGVMLVVCVVLCPLCGWMPLNRLRSRAE